MGETGLLAAGFFRAEEGDFYLIAALGAGHIQSYRLLHYPFHECGGYGVDIVKALVQEVQPVHYFPDSLRLFCGSCIGYVFLSQIMLLIDCN